MEDDRIIEPFEARDESALEETEKKYSSYCRKIAMNVLDDEQEAQQCMNDVLLKLWNSIPPEKPQYFTAYIATITRNDAINKLCRGNERKLGKMAPIDELEDVLPDVGSAGR